MQLEDGIMKKYQKSLMIAAGAGIFTAIVLTLGIMVGGVLSSAPTESVQAAPQPQAQADGPALVAAYEQALIDTYQQTLPSVVNIRITREFDEDTVRDFRRFFEDPDEDDEEGDEEGPEMPHEFGPDDLPENFFNRGSGSGFVWDEQGHIVTNNHVVEGATDIEVTFADDTAYEAEIIGTDPDSDLAVIKIDAPAGVLQPIALGESDDLQVGQIAIALGNPFGQDFTMTSGIISGVGRLIRGGNAGFSIPEVIQTDAPINPGNSGGPLLNIEGEVLGINTQIISQSGGSSGIGFAVPVNIAKEVIPTLIEGGEVEYAWLGISGGTVTSELIEARDLPEDTRGAVISQVMEDGPAEEAGLQGRSEDLEPQDEGFRFGGEIITAIDGTPLGGIDDLITYLVAETDPGDTVTLDIIDNDGQEKQVEVTLGVRPSSLDTTPDE